MKKNDYILNPKTGTPVFGTIPDIHNSSYIFPRGDIFLKYGEHRGASHGFGLRHIWEEHKTDILAMGYGDNSNEELTARYVSDILKTGARIYCEFARYTNERVTVLQSSIGVVVIEHKTDGNNNAIYSVITAYKLRRRKPHGQEIGRLT